MEGQERRSEFLVFQCGVCGQEIEAPASQAGRRAECPSCAAPLTVPFPQTAEDPESDADAARREAMKSRTLRIELGEW